MVTNIRPFEAPYPSSQVVEEKIKDLIKKKIVPKFITDLIGHLLVFDLNARWDIKEVK